jgi:glycosyltransferase involved in cell wall biosynthesis
MSGNNGQRRNLEIRTMSPRTQLKSGTARLWRWRADRARDRRQWARASRNYERYLAQVADDGPIWIQLGHARKESDDLAGAKLAYEQALTLAGSGGEARRHLAAVWTMERLAAAAGAIREAGAARDWPATAAAYADHLAILPDDGPVWVQYGHALREIGDPAGAMIAYRQAAALPASEEDGWFQLAGVLRSQGLDAAAEPHFRRAMQLAPRFEVYRNLPDQPNLLAAVSPVWKARCLILDISDLLYFLSDHGRVSGIQRVELELVKAILAADRTADSAAFDEIVFCFSEFGWAWALEPAALRELIAYTESEEVDSTTAEAVRERIRVRAAPCVPAAGSAYVVLGGFWGGADAWILSARMQSLGLAFGVLVHDLFAITMPELCVEGVGAQFEASLRAGLNTWDFIIANSAFTAGDVQDFIARNRLRPLPVITLPLAHGLEPLPLAGKPAELPEELKAQPFVLCVGTIEPRKNHAALLDVWASLAAGHPDLPQLVLAGRQGWRSEDLVRRLESGSDQKVRWLPGVSDPQLQAMYGACLFTVLPSFAEGWGLPVGEALSHGKVCVTSNRTAMPEAGGKFAVYADPHDKDDLSRVLEALLFDGRTLVRQQALIRRAFRPRTWSDVAGDLVAEISAFLTRPRSRAA